MTNRQVFNHRQRDADALVMEFGHVRGTRSLAAAVLAVVFAVLTPLPARAGAGVYTFSGGGYGHSVGMSQFGAYGMARDGYTSDEILTHYFTGATPATVDPALAIDDLWVNLQVERPSITLSVRSTGAEPAHPVTFTHAEESVVAEEGDAVTISRKPNGNCDVAGPGGSFTSPCFIDVEWDGWDEEPTSALVISGCQLVNWNIPTGSQYQPCTYARGTLHIRPDNNSNTLNLSVELDMESYILGISESPYFWADTGGMAALEAQAIAARSYAYARVLSRGSAEVRPWCWCQLYDTPVDQNYVGWGHGTQSWVDAVANTADVVMTHPEYTIDGLPRPIETYYSSSTYGYTENSENAFISVVPYLKSVDDHWSGLPAVGNSNYRWNRQFNGAQLASRLPGMSTVTAVEITECSNSGAALKLTFSGSGGPRTFHARDLRGLLDIPSQQIYAVGGSTPGDPACPSPGGEDPGTEEPPAEPIVEGAGVCVPKVPVKALVNRGNTLEKGDVGKDVRQLNRLLSAIGYYDGFIGKKFKRPTKKAVKQFERDTGLMVDGIVDDETREALLEARAVFLHAGAMSVAGDLSMGSGGPAVVGLQTVLGLTGFDPGPADGAFGPMTEAALRSFEKAAGIEEDGVADAQAKALIVDAIGLPPFPYCEG